MKVVERYPDGVFCWVDLATTDPEAAKAFYNGLFGWDFEDLPTDMGTIYTMCRIDGKNVAGLSALSPEMQEQGIPTVWSSYINHSDLDAVAEKFTAAGGNLMGPPFDVMDSGRMAFGLDTSGAPISMWQPKNHIGAQLVNMPNTFVWNELQTRDPEGAKAFYGKVFGWTYDSDPNGYIMCQENGRTQAGILQMDENWPPEIPNNWGVYFMVADLEASIAKVGALGGNIMVPATPAGELGKFSVISDPQGGAFTIMQFDGPVDDPPGF